MAKKGKIKARLIVWAATSAVLTGVLVTANVLLRDTFSSLINQVLGGKRPIISKEDTGINFNQDFLTKEEAYANGNEVTEKICEEGMILLKNENNALPLAKNAKVSIFGKNSVNLVYGGSGSAAPDPNGTRKTIYDSLEAAGIECNPSLKKFYEDNKKSGDGRSKNPDMEHGDSIPTLNTGETPQSSYSAELKATYSDYGDAAFVVLSRIAGENWDLPRTAFDNSERHYLELDNNERALIKSICDSGSFKHVIILLNGSNYIDCGFLKMTGDPAYDSKIDGCINIGSPGANGIMALGKILTGEVNPSGHTVDLLYTNYQNDPTWENFGGNFTPEGDNYYKPNGNASQYYGVEYEEGIYLGYRYYETRGFIDGETWYQNNVVYPFGYGLSYTTFDYEIQNKSALAGALDATAPFTVDVKVKNTGDVAGKAVVQLYVTAPYTNGGIEKAYKVLVGFAKTDKIAKNGTDTVTITVDPYNFASFDSHNKKVTGGGYILESGDYTFHVATDSHTDIADGTFVKNLASDYVFSKDPVTNKDVKALFTDVTDHMVNSCENLSRANFAGTMPKRITDAQRILDAETLAKLTSFDSTNDEVFTEMPTMGAELDEPVDFFELAGKEYDDPLWEDFLDQLTFDEYLRLFNEGCYSTADITRGTGDDAEVIVPATTSADGPTGIVSFLGYGDKVPVYGTCYYMSECLLAQTYNLELATEEAHAIGNECLVGDERGTGLAYPGWYAPGVNLHRSPFSGRNTEYYSEDPLLAGKFAAQVIKGVQEKGVYANVKHFAVNDQETHRSANGIATWLDEQAMRELYLKPFEIAVKEGKSRGLMTSFNRIGTTWAGGDYRLVTKVLRDEWGFVGSVICDFHTTKYMDSKQMLYAGGDLNLAGNQSIMLQTSGKYDTPYVSTTSAKDANLLRRAAHRTLYCIANSGAMKAKVLGYKPPIWTIGLTIGTCAIGAGIVGWGAWAILTTFKKKPTVVPAE